MPGSEPERAEAGPAGEPSQQPRVEVRRSRRRRSTVTAYRDGDRTIVLIPARFNRAQEDEWVSRMLGRLSAQERRRRPGDEELMRRAQALSERHLGGLARPASVSWVTNQNTRWGSCTPADRTIRLSTRLLGMPPWVIDYVLLHELAHLIQPGHGERFWSLLDSYPRTERARGFLEGFAAARDLPDQPDHPDSLDPDLLDPDLPDPELLGPELPGPLEQPGLHGVPGEHDLPEHVFGTEPDDHGPAGGLSQR